jgi:tyrosine-protein phosphatase SIW14
LKTFTRIIGVPGLKNFGVIKEGQVYRSAQPTNNAHLQQPIAFKSILNLREEDEKDFGPDIQIFNWPLNVFSYIATEEFDKILTLITQEMYQPLLIHCLQGHDRTGVICACYRMAIDSWTLEEAKEEMDTYGYNPLWFMLTEAVEHYAKNKGYL